VDHPVYIGTWKIMTILKAGKMNEIADRKTSRKAEVPMGRRCQE
jgi:hypothetical protein